MTSLKRLSGLLSPLLVSLFPTSPAHAVQLTYKLFVLGVPVAEAQMMVELNQTSYRMALNYKTTGLGSLMSGDHLEESTRGVLGADGPLPNEYFSTIHLHGQDRRMSLAYHGGTPTIVAIDPPNESERENVPPAARAHTVDSLSATVAMINFAARTGKCDLSLRTYDGRRLEAFSAHTSGEEDVPTSVHSDFAGRSLRCDYLAQPLAGFRIDTGRAEDAKVRQGTLWLAPLVPGLPRLPMRGEIDTRFLGRATMYLTLVKP